MGSAAFSFLIAPATLTFRHQAAYNPNFAFHNWGYNPRNFMWQLGYSTRLLDRTKQYEFVTNCNAYAVS